MPHRLSTDAAPWLADPAVRRVLEAFRPEDQPRFVGGCVRNALIHGGPTDLDIAVVCRPEETISRLEAAGLKAIPTGLDHGTVTTLAALEGEEKGEPIEITTLRRDEETDGRHAVVAFTKNWAEDAARRDFTMNALYADPNGTVVDPLGGGVADLKARRLRFIGDAEERIREDYLRILRYFRFFAWYGQAAPEATDLAAIKALRNGVEGLARERIGHETRKLLAAPDPTASLTLMRRTGADAPLYGALLERSEEQWRALLTAETTLDLAPSWLRRLLFAFGERADLQDLLRLSKAETTALAARKDAADQASEIAAYRYGAEAALDAALIKAAAAGETLDPATPARLEAAASKAFPLTAKDLIGAGVTPGPALGALLKSAEAHWVGSGFVLSRVALLAWAAKKRQKD